MSNTTRFILIAFGLAAFLALFVVDFNVHGVATWWSYVTFAAGFASVMGLVIRAAGNVANDSKKADNITRNDFL